ncbi:MAG: T9SS type A sorting domain-containing protein [Vicingaceae bacterium]|nr:T9SS type A sorting domain-containing protein [Vicingaceae bacterium]
MNFQLYKLSTFFFLLFTFNSFAQDTLFDLGVNKTLIAKYNQSIKEKNSEIFRKKPKQSKILLTLPFLDDFSQNWHFPNENLWQDIYVHINSSFPINPPSYGVATFDGLDSIGFPYNFMPTSYGEADVLTSQPIDLSVVTDSVFLSFQYQPQGNGNKPETQDSLRLEFFRQADSTWVRAWGKAGSSTHPFKKVMVYVGSDFHNNEFQFRFKNFATLSGNVDHWHIDYVYLNDNRTSADTLLNDVALITNHFSLLNQLTAMPWDHYKTDTIGLMAEVMPVSYKNNFNFTYDVFYKYEVSDNNGAGPVVEVYPTGVASKNAFAYSTLTEPQAVYQITPSFLNDFTFPTDNSTNKVFQIKNYFDIIPFVDDNQRNDTVKSFQVFGSYYSYDDGSAELGYGIQGVGGKLANQFVIKKTDTLTAMQIYFNPIRDNISAESFKLTVWSSLNPEIVIYQQNDFFYPIYSFTDAFVHYELATPLILPAGTYYFGYEKITAPFLNVGYDVNTNNRSKIWYNSQGVWLNPSASIPNGSLMLRPVFGTTGDPISSIKENEVNSDFKIFPNPATNYVYFEHIGKTQSLEFNVELIDMFGRTIVETQTTKTNKIDVSNISKGIYFIRFSNNTSNQLIVKKVIIQ